MIKVNCDYKAEVQKRDDRINLNSPLLGRSKGGKVDCIKGLGKGRFIKGNERTVRVRIGGGTARNTWKDGGGGLCKGLACGTSCVQAEESSDDVQGE